MTARRAFVSIALVAALAVARPDAQAAKGILLLAHGGSPAWNTNVSAIATEANRTLPTEVAFGMADRSAIAGAIDRLKARGVNEIVAVPLFVSSYSSVLTSTEYLLGLRADKPAAVEIFARMRHGAGAAGDHTAHTTSDAPPAPTTPIAIGAPIRMTSALDAHPIVRDIVVDRAQSMSRQPAGESVFLVAHGPNDEDDNAKWLQSLGELSQSIAQTVRFAHVEGLTVRDDAPAPIKQAATNALRGKVTAESARGRRVLIVPVVLSYGGIEAGIRARLAGLPYDMADKALLPDARLVDWVLAQAKGPSWGGPGCGPPWRGLPRHPRYEPP